MEILLELMGYQVKTAHDGESAIRMIAEFIPQVALIDIGLPGLNGYELARRLLALPQVNGITLIAQTGWGRDEDRELSRQAGFQHHLHQADRSPATGEAPGRDSWFNVASVDYLAVENMKGKRPKRFSVPQKNDTLGVTDDNPN